MEHAVQDHSPPKDWDRSGLPGWAYFSDELLALEKEELFRKHWQLACHVSDVPEPGNYMTFDVGDERALIIRGRDNVVRAFHNLCRHRGSRVVADEQGMCKSALICPYHGWAYNLDGTLRGAAQPKSFPPLDPVEFGLKPLDMEIWQGFIFVRFKTGDQPSVSEIMARFEPELEPYGLADMVPADTLVWADETAVNWKAIRDVDNEGYHVAMAHPALQDLYGKGYVDEAFEGGVARSYAPFNEGPGSLWSVRAYKSTLPDAHWLPESHRTAWLYYGIFPNTVIGVYPDSMIFYQEFPDGTGKSRLRGASYKYRDESREMRLARYLSGRIDRITAEEDQMLTIWSCEAALSSAFDGIILSDLEYGVKSYHDQLRALFPVLTLDEPPAPGTMAEVNARMLAERG